jgi:CRP-like cAMP-binding protein
MVSLEELAGAELLQPFAPAYVLQLASLARVVEYQADEVIFVQGQPERLIYVVLRGTVTLDVKAPDSEDIAFHKVGPGGLLGWSPLLGRQLMTATARALTGCRLAALDAEQVRELAEQSTEFEVGLFRCLADALAERLQATHQQLTAGCHHHEGAVGR